MQDDDPKTDIEYVTLPELTEKDWLEIKALAVKLFDQKLYDGNMGKVYIAAFLEWIDLNSKNIAVNVDDLRQFH